MMRKVLIALATAGSALAVATPAAAQYYPQPIVRAPVYNQGYGYNNGYAYNGYGYNNVNWGHVRSLQARVDRIQRDLGHLASHRMISRNEYRNRQEDARDIERRLRRDARDGRGLNGQEVYQAERRIARLEQRIARDMRDGRRYGW
jgi:hypothetical protein